MQFFRFSQMPSPTSPRGNTTLGRMWRVLPTQAERRHACTHGIKTTRLKCLPIRRLRPMIPGRTSVRLNVQYELIAVISRRCWSMCQPFLSRIRFLIQVHVTQEIVVSSTFLRPPKNEVSVTKFSMKRFMYYRNLSHIFTEPPVDLRMSKALKCVTWFGRCLLFLAHK